MFALKYFLMYTYIYISFINTYREQTLLNAIKKKKEKLFIKNIPPTSTTFVLMP